MINVETWMKEAVEKLKSKFGDRLLFIGLQGSYTRNEAREDSDFDIMMILDEVALNDLDDYRSILRSMPEGHKAGGFTSGKNELLAWPKFEIFQLSRDTVTYYGDLKPLLPEVGRKDIEDSVKISASAIYHYTANSYIAGDEQSRADGLKPIFKTFFFMMQVINYLRSGEFVKTRKELAAKLSGNEAEMLKLGSNFEYFEQVKKDSPDLLFQKLLNWSAKTLQENF